MQDFRTVAAFLQHADQRREACKCRGNLCQTYQCVARFYC